MNCTKCGKLCTFVPQHGLWWCEDCKGYLPPMPPPAPKSHLGVAIGVPLGILGGIMVLGILAAVAIPAFMDYSKKPKAGEAEVNLEALYRNARAYYEANRELPPGKTGPTPALGDCCSSFEYRGKCAANLAQWRDDPTWGALDFSVDRAHYFSYEYEKTADGFNVRAYGDLDCDTTTLTFELGGILIDGNLVKGPIRQMRPTE